MARGPRHRRPEEVQAAVLPQHRLGHADGGLYEFWRDRTRPEDDPAAWLATTTVITTDATDSAGRVHDRMPLTIAPDDLSAWLAPDLTDAGELHHLLRRPADGALRVRAVSTAVNSVRANGPELLDTSPDPLGLAD